MNENLKLQENINLHPNKNSGEATFAKIKLYDRCLSLTLDSQCYGSYCNTLHIIFDSPEDMIKLADAITKVANKATEYFNEYP
jgi:hypothetical protein